MAMKKVEFSKANLETCTAEKNPFTYVKKVKGHLNKAEKIFLAKNEGSIMSAKSDSCKSSR